MFTVQKSLLLAEKKGHVSVLFPRTYFTLYAIISNSLGWLDNTAQGGIQTQLDHWHLPLSFHRVRLLGHLNLNISRSTIHSA